MAQLVLLSSTSRLRGCLFDRQSAHKEKCCQRDGGSAAAINSSDTPVAGGDSRNVAAILLSLGFFAQRQEYRCYETGFFRAAIGGTHPGLFRLNPKRRTMGIARQNITRPFAAALAAPPPWHTEDGPGGLNGPGISKSPARGKTAVYSRRRREYHAYGTFARRVGHGRINGRTVVAPRVEIAGLAADT